MSSETARSLTYHGALEGDLKVYRLVGSEAVSSLFRFELTLVSEQWIPRSRLESEMLGEDISVTIHAGDGSREISGCVSGLCVSSVLDGQVEIRATVVPFLWFAGKRSDCRVFQEKTTDEIVKEVVGDLGQVVSEVDQGSVTKWPYCVQYRETDLSFVSRLLEHDGIFYFFRHDGGQHSMVLGNANSTFQDPVGPDLKLIQGVMGSRNDEGDLESWQMGLATVSGKWAHSDYNFEDAKTKLLVEQTVSQPVTRAKPFEVFDFPGEYPDKQVGKHLAVARADEIAADAIEYSGISRCRRLEAGRVFNVAEHADDDVRGQPFVATSVSHSVSTTDFVHGGAAGEPEYRNHFTGIPYDLAYRPRRVTPKPSVSGVETAVVVGPPGEEIYTDEYGRVKVRFHWDRVSNDHDQSSCWIRVAQGMAGREWGAMAIPRIGQEVVVEFLEGDPDRPLIVGSVYNSDQMPAYDPRRMASRIYLKTNSTKGGKGFNEIMLDDRKDSERMFLHAQKDFDLRVRNDVRTRTYGNEHQVVGWEKNGDKGGSRYVRVFQDHQLHVQRNQDEHIEGDYRLFVGGGQAADGGNLAAVIEENVAIAIGQGGLQLTTEGDVRQGVDGSSSLIVGQDWIRQVGGDLHTQVGGNRVEKASSWSVDVEQQANVKAGMKLAVDAGTELHLQGGANVVVEAGMSLTMKVGGNFININPGGIFIQGTLVGINSGGAPGAGSGCMVQPPVPPSPIDQQPEKASPSKPDHAHQEKAGYPSSE